MAQDLKTAYCIVQSTNYDTQNSKIISQSGVSSVAPLGEGKFIIDFTDGLFANVPSVQVTAAFNGNKGADLGSVTTSSIESGYAPANQMVHACLLWTTQKQCAIRTSFNGGSFNNWLSFSLTATGV